MTQNLITTLIGIGILVGCSILVKNNLIDQQMFDFVIMPVVMMLVGTNGLKKKKQ